MRWWAGRPSTARRAASWALLLLLVLPVAAFSPAARAGAAGPTVSVGIRNYTFQPARLTIAPGTTVRWTNLQFDANDVAVREGPVLFRSPQLRGGESFSYTFTMPGTYRYESSPHPFVVGEVVVVADERQFFPATGFAVEGVFLRYWRAHGLDLGDPGLSARASLALFGYPLGPAHDETLDGRATLVQYFERARFEYHPENPQPYDVLLGQFGRALHPPDPPATPLPGAAYAADTGHNLSGHFRDFWATNGGLAVFGLPLSEEFDERLADGRVYRVQYFERARLEYHPDNAAPYDVLLGQFGRQFAGGR